MITLQILCQMWEICRLSRIESFMKDLSQLTLVRWNFKSFLVMVETAKMNGGRKFGEKPTGRKHKLLTSDGILFDKNCLHKLSTSFGMAIGHKYNWTKQVWNSKVSGIEVLKLKVCDASKSVSTIFFAIFMKCSSLGNGILASNADHRGRAGVGWTNWAPSQLSQFLSIWTKLLFRHFTVLEILRTHSSHMSSHHKLVSLRFFYLDKETKKIS